jgi:hypothetical protein
MSDDEVFIGGVTRAWLRARSQNERYAVWKRARSPSVGWSSPGSTP